MKNAKSKRKRKQKYQRKKQINVQEFNVKKIIQNKNEIGRNS